MTTALGSDEGSSPGCPARRRSGQDDLDFLFCFIIRGVSDKMSFYVGKTKTLGVIQCERASGAGRLLIWAAAHPHLKCGSSNPYNSSMSII